MSGLKRRRRGSLVVQEVGSFRLDEAIVGLEFVQGSRLVALTAAGSVWVADSPGREARRLGGHDHGGLALAVQPGRALVATGGQDGTLRLWDSGGGRSVATIDTEAAWVERIAWRCDGSRVAATVGRRVGIWDASGSPVGFSDEHASTVADIAWSPDGQRLATAAYEGAAYLTADGVGPTDHVVLKGSSLELAWQPQGNYLAVGNQDATVLFVVIEKREALQMWGFPAKVLAMDWSDDGCWLATGSGTGVILWDASGPGPRGRTPTVLAGHNGFVTTVAWQPKGALLASGSADGRVCLFAPRKHAPSPTGGHGEPPTSEAEATIQLDGEATVVTWTTAGGLLAVGNRNGNASIYRCE